jgi:hypothetical protein
MATQAQHYQQSERLIAATAETPENAPMLAVAHALLAQALRKARRIERPARRPSNGLPPHLTWGDE